MIASSRRTARGGGIVAATWLIGLGMVFLLQQVLDLRWGQAWPMFVILAGAGSLVSLAVSFRGRRSWFAALAWPALLLVAGVLLLLSTTGQLGIGPWQLIGDWWPVALLAVGGWLLVGALIPGGATGQDRLEMRLDGAPEAAVKVGFGGGRLEIGAGRPGYLLTGRFEGVEARIKAHVPGRVELEPESFAWPWWERTPTWRLGLPTDVPVDLEIGSGAARTELDLTGVRVRNLRIGTGASETRVRLPADAGETHVKAESGAASLTFAVPAGVAARIRGRMALGSTRVDETRFPRTAAGWESPGYADAANRVEIEIQGGVGSVEVRGI